MIETPPSPEVEEIFDEANGHVALGELAESIPLFRKCVELQPGFFDGWHALGMALFKEPAGAFRLVSLVLLLAGVVGLKLTSAA